MDLIEAAIYTTELEQSAAVVLRVVEKADPRPFMALLLANLPNLTILYAQILEWDPFLDAVF